MDSFPAEYLPADLPPLDNPQTALPAIAKDPRLVDLIQDAVQRIPTSHQVILGDAREMSLEPESVHLVVTSPPYWTLKEYRDTAGQLGHVADYDDFLRDLDEVWQRCYRALVPGGRLICVVGDVCLSRRKNNGRHTVVPLHASIQEHCRSLDSTILPRSSGTRLPTRSTRPRKWRLSSSASPTSRMPSSRTTSNSSSCSESPAAIAALR